MLYFLIHLILKSLSNGVQTAQTTEKALESIQKISVGSIYL